jgi:methionyl aminopeptidase
VICKSPQDIEGIMRIGQICGQTLLYMLEQVEVGMNTRELDQLGAAFLKQHNAKSAPITAYNYPGWTCISVNDVVAHGVPSRDVVIKAGDIVNVDVSAVLEGYWGDTGATIIVPPVDPQKQRLLDVSQEALKAGIGAARAEQPVYEVSKAVHQVIKKHGYKTFVELGGHGVGRHIHEKPTIPNHFSRRARQKLQDGMVVTIEPFVNNGKGRIYTDDDEWTLRTTDGSLSAQFEHTVIITKDKPILATKVEGTWW